MKARKPLIRLVPLAASTCLFFIGVSTLVWSIEGPQSPAAASPNGAPPQTPTVSLASTQSGTGSTATQNVLSRPATAEQTTSPDSSNPDKAASKQAAASEKADKKNDAAAAEPSSPGVGWQNVAVYKTVHHKAAVARKFKVDGKVIIEWQLCPVCGKRHGADFDERVIDHYEKKAM